MHKKILIAVLFATVFFCTGNAQVQIKDISFQQAIQEAKAADKMVLLIIESPECSECNAVAKQGLSNATLGRSVNSSCITINISPNSNDRAVIDSLYHLNISLGLVFINADGNYLHKYGGSSSYYMTYLEQLNKALDMKEHPDKDYADVQKAYADGKRDFTLLYSLMVKKNALDIEHDQLTEEMLNLAPKDSAASLTFIQFLAEQAPPIGSKADQYMRKDGRNFNDAWYLLPLQKRISLNGKINYKSKNKAIKEKDLVYAERVASFTAGTYTDRTQSRKVHDKNMIDYFKGIKDTSAYLIASSKYYDQYLMSISVDSVQRADSMRRKEMFEAAMPTNKMLQTDGRALTGKSIQYAPATQYYTNELNDAAWSIYIYTHDPFYTAKALVWAKRANEFFDNPGAMDTYARLLYRTGNKEEAISWEEKAIKTYNSRKVPVAIVADYETILNKMKTGATVIDKY